MQCKRCGKVWVERVDKPLACPQCKRYDYDSDEVIPKEKKEPLEKSNVLELD